MSYKKLIAVLPFAALWAALPPKAGAQAQPQAPQQAQQPQQDQQGMVVVRDAQTGQLRAPTAAEMRALTPPATARMSAAPQPAMVTHPGGSRHVRLGERGLVYSVVKRGADGKLDQQCVHGEAAAAKAVHAGSGAKADAAPRKEGHHHD